MNKDCCSAQVVFGDGHTINCERPMKKKFSVGVFEEQAGYAVVEAKNRKEAEDIVQAQLNDVGIDGLKDFDPSHREIYLTDNAQELKDE